MTPIIGREASMHQFNAVVLAGGKSSRMGQDKALLEIDGESLLLRSQRVLAELGAKSVAVCRNDGADRSIQDIYPDSGPLGGIHAALMANSTLPTLVIPVDLPLINRADLNELIQLGFANQSSSHFSGLYIPIFIWNPAEILESLTARLEEGKRLSLRSFFESHKRAEVTLKDEKALANANTPQEWQAILEQAN